MTPNVVGTTLHYTTLDACPPAAALPAAKRRGVFLTSRSRPLQPLDLTRFDYIIGMDGNNLRAIKVRNKDTPAWTGRVGRDADT